MLKLVVVEDEVWMNPRTYTIRSWKYSGGAFKQALAQCLLSPERL
jgi:hypothetical protein